MNTKVLSILEFNKITEMLAEKASSEAGKNKCLKLVPISDKEKIAKDQSETEDALKRLLKNSSISFYSGNSIDETLKRVKKGQLISASELLSVSKVLDNALRVKSYGKNAQDDEPDCLTQYFETLEPLSDVNKEITRCILSAEEISDDASPELRHIRRQIQLQTEKIRSQLNKMVSTTYRTYLQDGVITMRNGRYCIPVKAEYKNNVPGIVHDQSQSASTFFIEPSAIVELNNKTHELEIMEEAEVERILRSLCALCAEHIQELQTDIKILAVLDFIFAKGLLAIDMNATKPVFNDDGIINIRKGRHPLLDRTKVVPIDINLGDTFDLLVITGPNTGGKTVSLKTIGLLTLMGQAGLHIPALDRSSLSVYDKVYADIGDEQSIEQSLSTFSSHMKNIVAILKNADKNTLCLFDELGAGTDPTEGAALAIAILSYLHERGIKTVATTHYSELKVYALKEPGVENASCEFDVGTLSPTYRLLIGVPGKSNAFSISSKLGLPDHIINLAKAQINKQDEDFEDVIIKLDQNRRRLEEDRLTIEQDKRAIASLKEDYEKKQSKLDDQRNRILDEARREAAEILKDAKETADLSIKAFNKSGNIRDMEESRRKIGKKLKEVSVSEDAIGKNSIKIKHNKNDFRLGSDVRILSMDLKGTVSSLPDDKGNLFVQCGIMRMSVNMDDIEFIEEKPDKNKGRKGQAYAASAGLSKSASISSEINLIGLKSDEAVSRLDKYLDDAYLSHLPSVRVVHGKGTGALRNAVWTHLKRLSYIKSYKLGEYGEGDSGVTIVEFK
ncbi:MAG: endonuclease MutS2 [Lachnospiraceae bacterium]|nr:endonuclease MutS2 [Lachnospiraceae bacterium]